MLDPDMAQPFTVTSKVENQAVASFLVGQQRLSQQLCDLLPSADSY